MAPPAPTALDWRRIAGLMRFLGGSVIGVGVLLVGVGLFQSINGDYTSYANTLAASFIVDGAGVILFSLGFLFAGLDRRPPPPPP